MKILHVIVGLGNGGAERTLAKICSGDQENVHQVVSLTSRGPVARQLSDQGIQVYALNMTKGGAPRALYRLRQLVRRISPEIVHGWMPHGMFFAWAATTYPARRRVKLVWGIRASDYGQGLESLGIRALVRGLGVLARVVRPTILAVGAEAKRTHTELGFDEDRIFVVQNGFAYPGLASSPEQTLLRHRLSKRQIEGTFVIGCVARYHPQKNHFGLIDALQEVASKGHRFLAVLVGEGLVEENYELSSYIALQQLESLILLGGPVDDPFSAHRLFDLHVLVSAFGEGFPNAVAESMMCGVPNVVTDVGDSAQLVGSTGWVVTAAEKSLIARAIADAMTEDAERFKKRGSAARSRILEKFPESKMLKGFQRAYRGDL